MIVDVYSLPENIGPVSSSDFSSPYLKQKIKYFNNVRTQLLIYIILYYFILAYDNEDWGNFHNEEHHSLYRSPNKVGMIKSRRLRQVGLSNNPYPEPNHPNSSY